MSEQIYGQNNGKQPPKIEYLPRTTYQEQLGNNTIFNGIKKEWIDDNIDRCLKAIDNLLIKP